MKATIMPNGKPSSEMSAEFFAAIRQGNLEEIQRLLRLDPKLVHARDENGLSPILVAAYHQQPEIADLLVEKTVAINIFEAAATGKTNAIIRHLARDPELVNAYSEDGFQPLGLAAFFGHLEAAEYLIKAGAAINSPSRNALMATPLHSAAAGGHLKIVLLLLAHNAEPNVREQGGYTPLHIAAQNGDLIMTRALLLGGADMDLKTDDGKTPRDLALQAGHTEVADFLDEGITRRFRARKRPSQTPG
jgi:ankyrin repeat protein